MKKLLADELSKEMESGRRSPSIIAKLMGLDVLPVPNISNKKAKKISDCYQQVSGSSGLSKNSRFHDSLSHRKNAMGQQKFKDVYEVVDRSYVETRSSSTRGATNRNFGEEEIGFIRQKYMDVNRFSTDENLQHSKEFHDGLEVLDSNKDLLVKFLQEPGPLFTKHLCDLHDAPETYYGCSHGTNFKKSLKCRPTDVIGCQIGGEIYPKINISNPHNRWNSCQCNMYDRDSTDSQESFIPVEGDGNASSNPTKIVVLKPNLVKAFSITKSVSSNSACGQQSDFELYDGCSNLKHLGPEVRDERSINTEFDMYGKKSRESRELAREITRRMRNKLGVDSFNVSSSGCRGYSADESSHDTSENDSSYESEFTTVSSRTSSSRRKHYKDPALGFMESSVNREARKRLSERWKMTHRSQEFGTSSKGSTLAEMLAIPDVDVRPQGSDTAVSQEDYFQKFGSNNGTAKPIAPLGISSRDGWKDSSSQNLSRCRSLPASVNRLGSPKSSIKREAVADEIYLIRKESITCAKTKAIKRNYRRKDVSSSESRKPSDDMYQKPESSCPISVVVDDSHEMQSTCDMMKNISDGRYSPEVKSVIFEMSSCKHDGTQSSLNALDVKEHKNEPELATPSVLPQDGSSTSDLPSMPQVGVSSCLQSAATHAESAASIKESEQPSPVSVLEVPFVEDLSSGSECFERVSAELLGLRKQLQLLKLESEVHNEGSMLISSDEYGEESSEVYVGKFFPQVGDCWRSCYLVDALTLSGLEKAGCELFLRTWHSPDCPIGPWVFEDLEKRYGELESCSRFERRLLFDHVNARIHEISQEFMDSEAWVRTPRKYIRPQRLEDVLKTELHKLLNKHESNLADNGLDTVILSEMRWMKPGEHIGAVGRDIEASLLDELIVESLPM